LQVVLPAQTPELHPSPDAQSASTEHVHSIAECVAEQVAAGPHWLSAVHAPQTPPTQTWPAAHCAFEVHDWHWLVHIVQTS
jgi:hypothetical protein